MKILIFLFMLFFSAPSFSTIDCSDPPEFGSRSISRQIIDFTLTMIGMTTPWCIDEQHKTSVKYDEDEDNVVFGDPFENISVFVPNMDEYVFDNGLANSCLNSSRFRRLKIDGDTSNREYWKRFRGEEIYRKEYIVQQGVPHTFSADRRSSISRWISPSRYYWSFGDGGRSYPKEENVNTVKYTYDHLGEYILSSVVITKYSSIGIGVRISGDFGSGYFRGTTPLPYIKSHGRGLDSCDSAIVKVVRNSRPIARPEVKRVYSSNGGVLYKFSSEKSYDPDGNMIIGNEWVIDGVRYNEASVYKYFEYGSERRRLAWSLSVSDGGDSSLVEDGSFYISSCMRCTPVDIISPPDGGMIP
ncbi:hypothetical protein Fbal_3486 [Ferrimonas balearica DSM 9799]|uniref:PKD domain-containing protein n=1 Tax=Ferrimonas balearica (strain DSM 9799 / CCM 4581 / KCTC 23876 / PAT) TaxID=550540 RepID=E1SN26_FERBD|nr:hypothetical protein [Ferrimonas balearica]ADN77684.1 hypothetical protein Fbal_3486 [Ferrimonas balearica DSM 9799]